MKARHTVGASDGLPAHHIDGFLDRLRTAQYSEVTLYKKRRVLSAFSRWMMSSNVALVHLDESATALFMERLTDAPAARVQFELAVLRLFLAYLRGEDIVRQRRVSNQSAIAQIYDRYLDYLKWGATIILAGIATKVLAGGEKSEAA